VPSGGKERRNEREGAVETGYRGGQGSASAVVPSGGKERRNER
jgi:hypothetical protein